MFVTGKPLQPSLIFENRATDLLSEWGSALHFSTLLSILLRHAIEKQPSLLLRAVNYNK
jgi:hypothetical protein